MIIICTLIASNVLQCIGIYVHSGKKSEFMFQPGPSALLWVFEDYTDAKAIKEFHSRKTYEGVLNVKIPPLAVWHPSSSL